MKYFTPCNIWTLVLGVACACGSAKDDLNGSSAGSGSFDDALDQPNESTGTLRAGQEPLTFPGGGTSGAAKSLSPSLAPDSIRQCDPQPSAGGAEPPPKVQTVCFYGADDDSVPAATIQQVVEVVGNDEWVHIRLTFNPDFVDNTYGDTAIGWGSVDDAVGDEPAAPPGAGAPPPDGATPPDAPSPPDGATPPDAPSPPDPAAADAGAPPAPPPPGEPTDGPPPPDGATPPEPPAAADAGSPPAPPGPRDGAPGREGPGRDGRPRPGKGGHTFKDLLGSDHAELQLVDANGEISMQFKLDYVSESSAAPSGFGSLGISGGEGKLIVGEPEWLLASTTSIDRNLNACGLGSFTESSPETDEVYTPAPDASDWDYRVSYEVWVAAEAFGSAGFGSALVENVHASPSKIEGDTLEVLPAPCPVDPGNPEAQPEPVPAALGLIR